MNNYYPDVWAIIEVTAPGHGTIRKILSGWYGGYCPSSSWRLSSGISDYESVKDTFVINTTSGSVYYCYKDSQGMNGYTSQIFENISETVLKTPDATIKEVKI